VLYLELEKLAYPYYNADQSNLPVSGGSQLPSTTFPVSSPSVPPLAYYQFMQHQQRLLAAAAARGDECALAMEKPEDFARFPSPLCRWGKASTQIDFCLMARTS